MKQGGYLLIEVVAIVFLIAILALTFLDITRTRRGQKLAHELLRQARKTVFAAQAVTDKGASLSNIDEMKILHDIVFPSGIAEQLARSIHRSYVADERAMGKTEQVNPSMAPWERLPADLRQSNIAQAADIGVKLDAIGAVVVPESAAAPAFAFTDQEVELLSKMEHDRWMRERIAAGWTYGEPRDNERKIHPDLRDWADLPENVKDLDRNAVRMIPAVLHDAGFQILRLPAS